jgi:hypothetical protein
LPGHCLVILATRIAEFTRGVLGQEKDPVELGVMALHGL